MRELYKPKPDREIIHARNFALDSTQVAAFNHAEEHIAAKTHRFVAQLLELGEGLTALGDVLGVQTTTDDIFGLNGAELRQNGCIHYPEL